MKYGICTGHMYKTWYKFLHITNNNHNKNFCFLFENDDLFYEHFPFDDNTTTHIIKLSLLYLPILSIPRAITIVQKLEYCLIILNNNLQHQFSCFVFIRNTLPPIESKNKADVINQHHQTNNGDWPQQPPCFHQLGDVEVTNDSSI